ncbi:conserved hypothetical protein [Perkinsus marinus ATCC 50983]|uniref:Uncharacterized protein n=1 Tax=Perkinsus marinus (strain ATCC 50983 / TXsc) TaxID=423536 RepID=C5LTX1_PERM5|nr:conserved hypothetical protein [Perkinsus marinus ATCC 50983]EEQ99769.1 conserved hypothetical protein [Perkinsus marinus ATCC 50983]|eukprot:XP_002767052.1 conserved hypothetical protein [Perkinsus marinus ATCC 50983]
MATYLGQCLTLGQLHTLAGATASFVAVISSYPLDLMKNRVASASLYKSPLDCMRITWKNEGFKGFYKGVSSPMIGDVAIGMTAFGVYGYMSTRLKQSSNNSFSPTKTAAISGGTAGLAAAVIGCPFEVVKLQLQMQYVRGLSASINVASSEYTYQESEFSKRKVNLISLMYWSNLIQAIILFMLVTRDQSTLIPHWSPMQVPYDLVASDHSEVLQWPAAYRCIMASDERVNPECANGQAGIYLGSCILWMLISQLLQAELVRHAGASLCAVVMTLGLPTTALAFSMPELMGDHIEPIDRSTMLALSVILLGVSLYRSANISDNAPVSPKSAAVLVQSTDSNGMYFRRR